MAHPWYHAVMAARRYGGEPEDYLSLEQWMDYTKSHVPDCRHRLFLHNSWGIFVGERVLGQTMCRPSDGKRLPVRPLLEDHVIQDFGKIPTLARCLDHLPAELLQNERSLVEQCQHSAEVFGGVWRDYQPLHQFLDWPHEHLSDGRYRRILHNGWGVALLAEAFGEAYQRASDDEALATRLLAEEHIHFELGRVPTLEECLEGIAIQRWMCVRAMPVSAVEGPDGAPV